MNRPEPHVAPVVEDPQEEDGKVGEEEKGRQDSHRQRLELLQHRPSHPEATEEGKGQVPGGEAEGVDGREGEEEVPP